MKFRIRIRRDDLEHAVLLPVATREGDTIASAVKRVLIASCADANLVFSRGASTLVISDEWQAAYRLSYVDPRHPCGLHADVDVPNDIPTAWL